SRGGLYSPAAARSAAALSVFWPTLTSLRDMSFVHVRKAALCAEGLQPCCRTQRGSLVRTLASARALRPFTSLRDMSLRRKPHKLASLGAFTGPLLRAAQQPCPSFPS